MGLRHFVDGFEPQIVRIRGKPKVIGYIRNGVFRSIIRYSKHVLYKREGRPPAIAKEAWIYQNIIKPKCRLWEVYDEERNIILRTTIANFDAHCEEWHWDGSRQLLLEEPYWQIEILGAPRPAQQRLL
ncbi:MAG: hypothetical protein N2506_04445 [Dehalococcoidales bacterium]|nr:hypothetical protein [Dehalococcoidales bacterium]